MELRYLPDKARYRTLTTDQLRAAYLVEQLFTPGRIDSVYMDVDRAVVASVVPTGQPLRLETADPLRAQYFCERREVGVINIAGPGTVTADGQTFAVAPRECLYIGRGTKQIVFASSDPANPAAFYLVSFPAHTTYPTRHATLDQARHFRLGTQEDANRRNLYQFIHADGIKSCQLVMGFTEIEAGSVWNTMPPHTHARRCEIYMYFDMQPQTRVLHVMGEPQECRVLWIGNRQVALSPAWSMHFGAGTQNYRFVWAMGGENQAFDDMDGVPVATLR